MPNYVGFYWTLPVKWAGFRELPRQAKEAAKRSQTIRYQMVKVQGYVHENSGTLTDEIVFMDVRPDRATDAVRRELSRACTLCRKKQATLVFVRFDKPRTGEGDFLQWRRNTSLINYIEKQGIERVELAPDPISIGDWYFDPSAHFRAWRQRDTEERTTRRDKALRELGAALACFPEGRGRWKKIAAMLNGGEVRTLTGRAWTAEGVRKAMARYFARP